MGSITDGGIYLFVLQANYQSIDQSFYCETADMKLWALWGILMWTGNKMFYNLRQMDK